MIKRLTKTGNSLALVLDRPLLEATKITLETELEVSTDGDVIIVTPVRSKDRTEKLKAGMEAIHARYAGVFRRLAE
jgi:antitoxin component of MazEF toxin-antitoxin module